jgi:hypothetical protein
MKLGKMLRKWIIAKKEGFGMNELLGIAAALIIAAFIIIPSMRDFAEGMMDGLADWWENTISKTIFPSSL